MTVPGASGLAPSGVADAFSAAGGRDRGLWWDPRLWGMAGVRLPLVDGRSRPDAEGGAGWRATMLAAPKPRRRMTVDRGSMLPVVVAEAAAGTNAALLRALAEAIVSESRTASVEERAEG